MAPVLGYWSLRGLAEPIRLALHYVGTPYVEKQYTLGTDLETCRQEWLSEKESLGLEFPNLPYYIDGDLKFSESAAILRYIGRKHGLVGSTEEQFIRLDVAEGIVRDQIMAIIMLCYGEDFETKKGPFITDVPNRMEKLAKLMKDRTYILGDQITIGDFCLLETLDRYVALVPTCLKAFPQLEAFRKRMGELPGIKKYRASADFKKIEDRFNGRVAKFGAGTY